MSSEDVPPVRSTTAVDEVVERWVDTLVDLEPTLATWLGRSGRTGEYSDTTPAGHAAYIAAATAALAELRATPAADDVDQVTKDDLESELALDLEYDALKLHLRDLNVIESPPQRLRDIIDLMPTATVDDWRDISSRFGNLPAAIDGYIETLRLGMAEHVVPAKHQVTAVAEQTSRLAAPDGYFGTTAAEAKLENGDALPPEVVEQLTANAVLAASAYEALGTFLRDELLAVATDQDGVGREAYALHSRKHVGATIDLDETYEWGLEELARMTAEQEAIADQIERGASVARAIEVLDGDPARQLDGTDALQRWMQAKSDQAVEELGRTHFDIPEPIRTLECRIAPTQEGGIYYSSPSDDFSRPGRMWWSVPVGVTRFNTWRETTTVYHEGVPGHHLQLGQAVFNRATLNTYRRSLAGSSGHAEGWALYAERLMAELGYLDDLGDRLGMLDGQRMRAARVVLDIGVHLGKPFPGTPGIEPGGIWNAENAFVFMKNNVNMEEGFVRFEVDRYLGWPGQAPSYKVGQRIWEELRAERARREGDAFDLRRFHSEALALGGVRLDTLQRALLAQAG